MAHTTSRQHSQVQAISPSQSSRKPTQTREEHVNRRPSCCEVTALFTRLSLWEFQTRARTYKATISLQDMRTWSHFFKSVDMKPLIMFEKNRRGFIRSYYSGLLKHQASPWNQCLSSCHQLDPCRRSSFFAMCVLQLNSSMHSQFEWVH